MRDKEEVQDMLDKVEDQIKNGNSIANDMLPEEDHPLQQAKKALEWVLEKKDNEEMEGKK